MESEKEFVKKRLKENTKYQIAKIIYWILLIALVVITVYFWPRIEDLGYIITAVSKYDDSFESFTEWFEIAMIILFFINGILIYVNCERSAYKKEYEIRSYYENKKREENSWTCKCGTVNTSNYIYCKICNTKRDADVIDGATAPFEKKKETWECECGKKDCEGNFCSNCGSKRLVKPVAIEKTIQTTEWLCETCGRVNHYTVGTCGCGQRKP